MFVVISTPDNKHTVNIILTQRTSLLITQLKGCEARHYLFFLYPYECRNSGPAAVSFNYKTKSYSVTIV
ncbi:hypothetical protein C3432_00700 [Citrobacter amalonaticus]|uniref:Uncharacterized protein n=1 Tax=Citrobacter amalonaticus TaxID=35703 RepID=A0A2S4S1X9_CITAM|nr:hypothetical protein C3432_00700 [Citrobacter amalonaticus]POT77414.1 hypothetical protein C3436_08370 [Citrobacter amalonaticus]POU67866.1 hypothetical protein C3430_01905 [Citrobacter amalonaticus]POV07470.1 hypothetical protein C3424_01915 [Citrobacter amalonaticus]